jgi:CTP synthase
MVTAVRYARENNIPYFGICLGMQMAVIEFARHVAGYEDAHSTEFNELTKHPVIDLMPDQVGITKKGGTMRLGKYPCQLAEDSCSAALYGTGMISERHRHRYEFNNNYRDDLIKCGLSLAGLSPNGSLVEIVELPKHRWFVGVQFHPEFKSRPNRAHPLFYGFIKAAVDSYDQSDSGPSLPNT